MRNYQKLGRNVKPGVDDRNRAHSVNRPLVSLGNLAIQRKFKPGLKVSTPQDHHEQEADHYADQVMGMPSNTVQNMAMDSKSACPAASGFSSGNVVPTGGRPLDRSTLAFFEQRIGDNFSDVRVHDGPAAGVMAESLQARAYTVGRDVVFGKNEYRPQEQAGQRLLSHELAHVVQQRNEKPRIDRQPSIMATIQVNDSLQVLFPFTSGDIKLTGGETVIAVSEPAGGLVRVQLPAPYLNAYEPFDIPVTIVSSSGQGDTVVYQSPPLGMLENAFDLGPDSLLPDIPEGVVVEIDPSQLPPGALSDAFDMRGWPISQVGRLTNALADQHLMNYGFNAAGSHSIGMVGYPNTTNLRALRNLDIPQSPILFGHTIAYVRVDGKIVTMTSFGPQSLAAAGIDSLTGTHAGVPGSIIQHMDPQPFPLSMSGTHGFPNTSGVSIEWPVSAARARSMSQHLSGAQADDLMRYAAYLEKCKGGQNCVGWALDQLEGELGGQVGQQGQPPLRHQSGMNTARQGKFQGMVGDALAHQQSGGKKGIPVVDLPNATDPAVAGQMSKTMRVIKWGGRILEVGGYAYSIYRIANASKEEMPFVVAEEALGTVAGPLGGVAAELYIQPMRELAAGRGDATLLILPIPYIAPLVRVIEPEKQDPEGGRLIRRAVLGNDPDAIDAVLRGMFGGY